MIRFSYSSLYVSGINLETTGSLQLSKIMKIFMNRHIVMNQKSEEKWIWKIYRVQKICCKDELGTRWVINIRYCEALFIYSILHWVHSENTNIHLNRIFFDNGLWIAFKTRLAIKWNFHFCWLLSDYKMHLLFILIGL